MTGAELLSCPVHVSKNLTARSFEKLAPTFCCLQFWTWKETYTSKFLTQACLSLGQMGPYGLAFAEDQLPGPTAPDSSCFGRCSEVKSRKLQTSVKFGTSDSALLEFCWQLLQELEKVMQAGRFVKLVLNNLRGASLLCSFLHALPIQVPCKNRIISYIHRK